MRLHHAPHLECGFQSSRRQLSKQFRLASGHLFKQMTIKAVIVRDIAAAAQDGREWPAQRREPPHGFSDPIEIGCPTRRYENVGATEQGLAIEFGCKTQQPIEKTVYCR